MSSLQDDDDDVGSWVERSRQLQKSKQLAEARRKMLEEQEQEYSAASAGKVYTSSKCCRPLLIVLFF